MPAQPQGVAGTAAAVVDVVVVDVVVVDVVDGGWVTRLGCAAGTPRPGVPAHPAATVAARTTNTVGTVVRSRRVTKDTREGRRPPVCDARTRETHSDLSNRDVPVHATNPHRAIDVFDRAARRESFVIGRGRSPAGFFERN